MYPKNAASPEPIAIGAVLLTADGAVQTSGVTVRIKPVGVAEADGGGTVAYSTDGIVIYTPTQAETNYTSFVLIATKASCIPASITVITTASATPGTVLLAPVTHTSAVVPRVTLTDTTTTNTDMRGTDGANTATPLDAAGTRTALGLASANLDAQIADLPTVAEFDARTLLSAEYFVVADYTAPLDAGSTRTALGLASANLDTQLSTIDTVVDGIATEVGKIPKSATALTSGQVRHSIAGGSAANITIGPHV
jgi:hypothetical protein